MDNRLPMIKPDMVSSTTHITAVMKEIANLTLSYFHRISR